MKLKEQPKTFLKVSSLALGCSQELELFIFRTKSSLWFSKVSCTKGVLWNARLEGELYLTSMDCMLTWSHTHNHPVSKLPRFFEDREDREFALQVIISKPDSWLEHNPHCQSATKEPTSWIHTVSSQHLLTTEVDFISPFKIRDKCIWLPQGEEMFEAKYTTRNSNILILHQGKHHVQNMIFCLRHSVWAAQDMLDIPLHLKIIQCQAFTSVLNSWTMNFPTASPANDERIKNPPGNFPSSAHECHFASHIYLTNLTDGLAWACNKHSIFGAGIGHPSHTTLPTVNWASPQESPILAIVAGEISLVNLKLCHVLSQLTVSMKAMAFLTPQPPCEEQGLPAQKMLFSDPDRKMSQEITPIQSLSCCYCAKHLLKMNSPC